jgi:hypothetical protein
MIFRNSLVGMAGIVVSFCLFGCGEQKPGTVKDEAMQVGRTGESFPAAPRDFSSKTPSDDDYFADMDGGYRRATAPTVKLDIDAIRGRTTWIVWTGGNDRFWDFMANHTFGAFDLLKILSSNPKVGYCEDPKSKMLGAPEHSFEGSPYSLKSKANCDAEGAQWFSPARSNRFDWYGLINEPCFEQAAGPDEYGLWLDHRKVNQNEGCPVHDPFEDDVKYPGVKIGARGTTVPVWSYYGKPSGIVGLRLFPNPDFDDAAKQKWMAAIKKNPDAFYTDKDFYNDKNFIRPYRVGMSCAFCHVGPSPTNPPKDPESPTWANLNSNPGAQYFWVDRIFIWNPEAAPANFIFQLFHTSKPGSLDTSLVSTDNINNPRTMNAVYNLGARLMAAKQWKEKLAGGELDNKQFNDYKETQSQSDLFLAPDTVWTPHVLKDGSDSVGGLGALNRVYLNIGLFSEEWLLHFNPLVGGKRITPIRIAVADKNSGYWQATQQMTPDMAVFFLESAKPDLLADTDYGKAHPPDQTKLARGKIVFAENCARCHSSKQPPNLCMLGTPCKAGQIIENSESYFDWMRSTSTGRTGEVQKPDFLANNFLSTDRRVSIQEMGINACSPLATNAIRNDIWDNFSSETYKELPATGKITLYNPVDGTPWQYKMPGGGRGYVRPASLVSVWSSAPFLQNNSVGRFNGDPRVEARLKAFDDGITKMLWPESRERDFKTTDPIPGIGDRVPGPSLIQRTTQRSYIKIPAGYLPFMVDALAGSWHALGHDVAPWLFTETGDVQIGPIPAGTPVNLIANINPLPESMGWYDSISYDVKLLKVILKLKHDLKSLPDGVTDEQVRAVFTKDVPDLLSVNKCPDFIVNKGHYFGSNLSDDDKYSLIEFLKTF